MARSKKFRSLLDVYAAPNAEELLLGFLRNVGCDHLLRGNGPRGAVESYLMSLVGEYGVSERQAERDVLAEINNLL